MKHIGLIPLRAGSKSIKGKNKKNLLYRPLYQWVLGECIMSKLDSIYVFTDDDEIIKQINTEYCWCPKVKALKRGKENATDTASTEAAMHEFSQRIEFEYDTISLIQATSPMLSRSHINQGLKNIEDGEYDSCLTGVTQKRFRWSMDGNSINYDFRNRPRRQDFDNEFFENGAFYITTKEVFCDSLLRIGGRVGLIVMPERSYFEIDEPSDWPIVESLVKESLKERAYMPSRIKLLVLDVDGVFTPGNMEVSDDGEFSKSFSLRDGKGLELLRNSGVVIVVMTSEISSIVKARMEKLKIANLFMGVKDKYSRLDSLCDKFSISRNEIAYVGDDVNDLCNIISVGYSFTPNDAILEVKQHADFILNNKGGKEAVREVCEKIIKINNKKQKT